MLYFRYLINVFYSLLFITVKNNLLKWIRAYLIIQEEVGNYKGGSG